MPRLYSSNISGLSKVKNANLMSRASCRHVVCATDVSLTVVLIAASVVG